MQIKFLKKLTFAALFSGLIIFSMACTESTPQTDIKAAAAKPLQIVVHKSPTCECCTDWEDHLTMAGFEVTSEQHKNMSPIKAKFGISRHLASCHTAIIDGYIIEGHVPASDIKRLLTERPEIAGLTAPGMPKKSPGMQPHGAPPKGYDVLSFTESGETDVFVSY